MSIAEDLYSRLPAVAQDFVCSLKGWRIKQRRYGGQFSRTLHEAEDRIRWNQERWEQFRDRRFGAFLREVAAKAPFYRRRFRETGFDPDRVWEPGDLSRLPVLTKQEAQEHIQELTPDGLSLGPRVAVHTSGTTGAGLRFHATVEAEREQWAVWWRYRRWHGIKPGTWCGYFGGRAIVPPGQEEPPFWRINYPGRQILFSGYHMRPQNLGAYIDELRRRHPPWLHGYPSLLALLAAYLIDTGADLGYQVRWITTGAESLLPQQARLVRRAFGVRPRQHYGMAEAVANFSECEFGRLHVDEDFAAVEFVPIGDGETYRIVGTNFSNAATPLVRYDTGDIARLLPGRCACGRPGRLVERVDGRQEDYVILRNGARVGRMDHIFKDMVRVREAQIYQEKPGELVYRIARGSGYGKEDEERLLRETRLRLGDQVSVRIEYVERLERTSSGKLRFVVSKIPEAQIAAAGESAGHLRGDETGSARLGPR